VFSYPLVTGSPDQVLMGPNNMVLTQSFASEIFGKENPIGKTVLLNNEYNFIVSGILKDIPDNTQFSFKFLVPWAFARQAGFDDNYWGNNSTTTYALLKQGTQIETFNKKISNLRK
jgi:hypothetical protein